MKIVHVAIRFPPATGGGEQVVYNLAKEQVKMENEVYVITTDLMREVPREVDRRLPRREVMDGINVIRMKTCPTLLPVWGYGSVFFGLKKVLNEIKPDIVHTHSYGYFHSDLLARFRKSSDWKLVMTSHGFTPGRGFFRFVKEMYTKFIGKKTMKSLDAAMALSKRDKKVFEELGAKNVYVIPNGIDLSIFENLPNKNIFRDRYGIKGKMILNVGRLEKIKGQKILIEAFSNITKDFSDTMLVIVGEDWGELKGLKELIRELNQEEKVIFTGNILHSKMPEVYASADIFVLSSFDESFGITLLEAMVCGLPIVATNVGAVPEVVGDASLLVDPNSQSIYGGVIKLLEDENLSAKLAEKGKRRVADFSWEKIANSVVKIYKEVEMG